MDIPARIKAFVFIFSLSLIFFIVSLLPISKIHAQTFTMPPGEPTQNSTTSNPTNPSAPNNLHNWTQTVMIEVMSALTCQIAGIDPINPKQQCLGVDQANGGIGFVNPPAGGGGAIGAMGHMIASLYTPPMHASDYFQNLAQNFGIAKKSYAQTTGTGFQSLIPLLRLWTSFRNIVYLLFVIVFVAIGLAIMLRVKVDPRTVMTIQNQIPKIIVGILLVTFSYAIAGFLIDMMYVSIHIGGNLIVSSEPDPTKFDRSLPTTLSRETNPFQAVGHSQDSGNAALGLFNLVWNPSISIGAIVKGFLTPSLDLFGKGMIEIPDVIPFLSGLLDFVLESIVHGALWLFGAFLGTVAGLLAFIVILFALIIALFRLWFTLIKAYVTILIDVVLAPFWILGSLIPGSPFSASGWFRDIIANLSAFPLVIGMLLLAKAFMLGFSTGDDASYFVPPLIGDRNFTQLGPLISLGIVLMTPNAVNMLKAALKAPKVETGIGGAIGAGNPMGLFGKGAQLGSAYFGLTQLKTAAGYIPGFKGKLGAKTTT